MTNATLASTNGLRARNKLDKLRRIMDAAQSLFVAKGFDDTTMREIAVRAGVGLGTIFLYAKDKRDLLFLTINEPLQHITQRAERAVDPKAPMIDNLLAIAKLHYRFFGEQPALARLALREMIFYDSGTQAASFQKTRERLIRLFGHTIERAIANAEIAPSEPPLFVGWTLFCIFQVELRRWLASDVTNLRAGLRELERAFRLLIVGFGTAVEQPLPTSTNSRQRHKKVTRSNVTDFAK
jgi:AcrR family transcriptional regulator